MKHLIKKIIKKWQYSFTGFLIAFKEEKALWAYFILFIIIIGLGIWVKLDFVKWAIVILSIFITFTIEVINTALEAAVDAMSFQYNIKVKKIKDIAAAATLVIVIGSIITWLIIFIPAIKGVL